MIEMSDYTNAGLCKLQCMQCEYALVGIGRITLSSAQFAGDDQIMHNITISPAAITYYAYYGRTFTAVIDQFVL